MSDSPEANGASSAPLPTPSAQVVAREHLPRPVAKIPRLNDSEEARKRHPHSRERDIRHAAERFASTPRNIFVHWVQPILDQRRSDLQATGVIRKKYYKSAAQLWPAVANDIEMHDQSFFWNTMASQLQLCVKTSFANAESVVRRGGVEHEFGNYVLYAEIAVSEYLGTTLPAMVLENASKAPPHSEKIGDADRDHAQDKAIELEKATITLDAISPAGVGKLSVSDVNATGDMLDTLPEPFCSEKKMLYSHSAHYDLDEVRQAVGKQQTAKLRQLAALLDKTGKELFYYYTVPHLGKEMYPAMGDTVTSKAADIWRFLGGPAKDSWLQASVNLKKRLGDGDVDGLETLQLDSLDAETLRLHDLALEAIDRSKEI